MFWISESKISPIAMIVGAAVTVSSTMTVSQQAFAGENMVSLTDSVSVQSSFTAQNVNVSAIKPKVFVLEQSLSSFLRQAARRSGYQIALSKRVKGVLKKVELPTDIREIMPEIAEQFDLKWHYQQKQLFVSVSSENANRVIFLGSMRYDDLQRAIEQAGIESSSYELSHVEESNSVIVNGSVSYISNIELIIDSYQKNKKNKKSGVKVIRFGVVGN